MSSVNALMFYPVKSMAGNNTDRLEVEARGPVGDRRWMVVDQNMRFVTGRVVPALSLCQASLEPDGISLSYKGQRLAVALPNSSAERKQAVVWRDSLTVSDAGQAAADWLTANFGRELRLVYQTDNDHRLLPDTKARNRGDEVSFADGYPLLLTTTASLQDVNSRLRSPVSMRNFRPNVVAATDVPFIEDEWREIAIGDVRFAVASRCSRCIFTTVNPDSGERREDGEPLKTLRSYRRDDASGQIMFGVNLIPLGDGTLRRDADISVVA